MPVTKSVSLKSIITTVESKLDVTLGYTVKSVPPSGKCRIKNIYWNPITHKVVVEYEDTPI